MIGHAYLRHYVMSKQVTSSTWTDTPTLDIWIRQKNPMKGMSVVIETCYIPSGSDQRRSHMGPS